MDAKQETEFAETDVLDEDVMDEMENFEATQVLDETQDELSDTRTQKNRFLENIEEATVVLDNNASEKEG